MISPPVVTVEGVEWERSVREGARWEAVKRGKDGGSVAVIVDTKAAEFREFMGNLWPEWAQRVNPVAAVFFQGGELKIIGSDDDDAAMRAYAKAVKP